MARGSRVPVKRSFSCFFFFVFFFGSDVAARISRVSVVLEKKGNAIVAAICVDFGSNSSIVGENHQY